MYINGIYEPFRKTLIQSKRSFSELATKYNVYCGLQRLLDSFVSQYPSWNGKPYK